MLLGAKWSLILGFLRPERPGEVHFAHTLAIYPGVDSFVFPIELSANEEKTFQRSEDKDECEGCI